VLVDLAGTAIHVEQGIVDRDEIANLRDEFDDAIRSLGCRLERFDIGRYYNRRRSPVPDHPARETEFDFFILLNVGTVTYSG
jgi:hypothetical protein